MSRRRDAFRIPRLVASASALIVLTVSAVTAPGTALPDAAAAAAKQPSFAQRFAAADATKGAMFRWWWPSSVEPAAAVAQLEDVAAAGYKGVEIAFVMDGTDYVVDPADYEYGDANWRSAVKAVLARATKLHLQVDLTLGGRWPAAIPGLDVASDSASQELVTARSVVAGGETFAGSAPAPSPRTYEERTVDDDGAVQTQTKTSEAHLVSAVAAKCVSDCSEDVPVVDLNSTEPIDISSGGEVTWTAPEGATWVIVAGWQRGTAQRNDAPFGTTVSPLSDPESRVINHFDADGANSFIRWFSRMLDPSARSLLAANGGSIFEDSLELRGAQLWTSGFAAEFADQHGYEITPFLPAVAYSEPASPFAPKIAQYAVPDDQAEQLERVRVDVDATLERLWSTQHVAPITEWAHGLGLAFRAQPYGESFDLGSAAAALDVSECESLGCSEEQFRTLATGVTLAGKRLVSSEMLPGGFGNLYGLTPAEIATLANEEYALGANQLVFHGLPYPTIPPSADGTVVDSSAQWPGFHAFGATIGEAFGPRQATWTMEPTLADYYSRMQQVLQAGSARYDVAVLNTESGNGTASTDGAFLAAGGVGYSYGYVTPGSLVGQPVRDGRLDPDGAAFGALIVGPDPVDVETAAELERVARAGLTVVVMDGGPDRASGWAASKDAAAADDRAVRRAIARALSGPRSYEADGEREVTQILAAAKVSKATVGSPEMPAVQRRAGAVTYTVVFNRHDSKTSSVDISGEPGLVPYILNPWTGSVKPAGVWSEFRGVYTIRPLVIESGGAGIVALAPKSFAPGAETKHVTSTTGLDARYTGGKVRITADSNGTYGASLSDRKNVSAVVRGVVKKYPLTSWDLKLDEWKPGPAGASSSVTRHTIHRVADIGPEPWSSIDGLENAVGVGSYATSVRASQDLASASAKLVFAGISGSYRVWVNGKLLPPSDQVGSTVDLGSALQPGTNAIRIDVASPLLNQLRVHRPAEFGERTPTVNGITGPVILDPYKTVIAKP